MKKKNIKKENVKKNRTGILLTGILLSVTIIAAVFFGINRRSYELHLPTQENLSGISFEKEGRQAKITEGGEIEDLLYVLGGSGKGRTTKEESISDAPVNAKESVKVDLHFAEQGTSTLFVYQKGGGYYIEQPYNGIYRISGEEYNAVEKYVR